MSKWTRIIVLLLLLNAALMAHIIYQWKTEVINYNGVYAGLEE